MANRAVSYEYCKVKAAKLRRRSWFYVSRIADEMYKQTDSFTVLSCKYKVNRCDKKAVTYCSDNQYLLSMKLLYA